MNTLEACDVLVVGGGPAGSTLARALTDAGMDAVVLDARRFPRDKPCAGWITPRVVSALGLDLEEYARERVLEPLRGFRVGVLGGKAADVLYPGEPASYGILRREFDAYLLSRCRARLRLGEPLRSLRREGGLWVVNESMSARLLVGAGGHFCPVARRLAPEGPVRVPPIMAMEAEFELPASQAAGGPRPGIPQLLFAPDLKGYAWSLRKGGYLNAGFGGDYGADAARGLRRAWTLLQDCGAVPAGAPLPARGHCYHVRARTPRARAGDGFLLVGDAAGLAHPKTGEGILAAVESALLAAASLREGGLGEEGIALYARRAARRFGPPGGAPKRLPAALAPLGRRLLGSPWFARRVVLDRWFLGEGRP